ncbi:MAG: hypothetical protein ACKN81_12985, partial [Pirellulaceae bacterium]
RPIEQRLSVVRDQLQSLGLEKVPDTFFHLFCTPIESIIGMYQSHCWSASPSFRSATGKVYSRFWRRANSST